MPELKIEFQHFSSKSLRDFVQPFNLEEGPLIRCAFFDDTVLLDICHIITDGLSMAILFTELNDFYGGKIPSYKPGSLPLPDDNLIKVNTDFWSKQFSQPFSNLQLTPDKESSLFYGGQGTSILHSLGKNLTKRVEKFCLNLAITPFIFYFAAFIYFLSKECGQNDVVTSTNFSCRSHHSMRTFALLATLVPVRFKVDFSLSVRDYLVKVNEYVKSVLHHQSFDTEKLVNHFNFKDLRDFSRTVFTFEHPKIADIRLNNKKCQYLPVPSRHSEADFTICFFPFKDNAKMLTIFRSDLYSFPKVRQLLRSYIKVIRDFCDFEYLNSTI